jgi:hypothetical protein
MTPLAEAGFSGASITIAQFHSSGRNFAGRWPCACDLNVIAYVDRTR